LFDQVGLVPEEINSLEQLAKIPFTSKATLRQSYPYEMFAVPLREIECIFSRIEKVEPHICVVITRRDGEDIVEVLVEISERNLF